MELRVDDEQLAKMGATIEVLGGAVRFLMAERITSYPAEDRERIFAALQQALSTPSHAVKGLDEGAALVFADIAVWQPQAAQRLIEGARGLLVQTQGSDDEAGSQPS